MIHDKDYKIMVSYPEHPDYNYETRLVRINLDHERKRDIAKGNGFIISPPTTTNKDVQERRNIFSSKFGQTLADANPFINRYRCACKAGGLEGRVNYGVECKICGKKVKYVDDNFSYFGWIVLDDYYIIHPNIYNALVKFIGSKDDLEAILYVEDNKDENGHSIELNKKEQRQANKHAKQNIAFRGIGMIEFYNRFDEIMEHFKNINRNKPAKMEYYNDIMRDRELVFTQSIPVYTTHMRPFDSPEKGDFNFEKTNKMFYLMSRLVAKLNMNTLKIFRKPKNNNLYLFELQSTFMELQDEIDNILSGKKGNIRLLVGGRYNMAARTVIVQDPTLRIDQVVLPYWVLVEILQQQIVNVLEKTYNYSPNEAYNIWYRASIIEEEQVIQIIQGLMFANPEGLPLIINRNPTIDKGGTLQVFCIRMTFDFTMSLSLQVLELLAADFDGDVLNILYIINKLFYQASNRLLNPRNSAYISNNDGKCNPSVIPKWDTMINSNTLLRLSRDKYSQEQLERIRQIKEKNKYQAI